MTKLSPIIEKAWDRTVPLPKFASILIVDDQRFDRQRMRRLCTELEFETYIVEADTLESMGTALERDNFDLVILDYSLPDGTGLDAIHAIKFHEAHRRSAIIMVTGQNESEIAIEAMKQGCSDYIDKNNLSLASLRRASVNALQKSALSSGIEAQEMMRLRVEKVLQGFTRECVLEIKPMLSRMMRQMRNLSDNAGTINQQTRTDLDSSCMRLWEFLTDLESFDGKDIVDHEFGDAGLTANGQPGLDMPEPDKLTDQKPNKDSAASTRPLAARGRLFSRQARPI